MRSERCGPRLACRRYEPAAAAARLGQCGGATFTGGGGRRVSFRPPTGAAAEWRRVFPAALSPPLLPASDAERGRGHWSRGQLSPARLKVVRLRCCRSRWSGGGAVPFRGQTVSPGAWESVCSAVIRHRSGSELAPGTTSSVWTCVSADAGMRTASLARGCTSD